jgi:hypothetical protein
MTNGNDNGQVTALGAPTYGKYAAIIVDVSRSGLQIELETPLPTGIEVKVEFNGLIVVGEVLTHRLHEAGRYRIGVQIREVAESHHAMALSALDKALTEARPAGVCEAG